MNKREWFYIGNKQQQVGPIPEETFFQLFKDGKLNETSIVWTEGMANWLSAANISDLQAFIQKTPVQYAGFWRRFCANFLDGIILYFLGGVIGLGIVFGMPDIDPDNGNFYIICDIIGIIISWLYYAFMESSSKQGTLGKKATKIKVTDLNGNRITFGRASIRWLWLIILTPLTLGLNCFVIPFTQRKQGWHDMLAGCLLQKVK